MIAIQARVGYQSLEGGFWTLTTEEGQLLVPTNMPVQLQMIGAQVHCIIQYSDAMSMMMMGDLVDIIGFKTLDSSEYPSI